MVKTACKNRATSYLGNGSHVYFHGISATKFLPFCPYMEEKVPVGVYGTFKNTMKSMLKMEITIIHG
jgi:hypothetical protein